MACGSKRAHPARPGLPEQAKSTLTHNANPSVSSAAHQAITSNLNDFGLRVFQRVAPNNQNFATSPVSAFVALTMAAHGAQGITAHEMKAVLYPDVALTDIQAATNQLESGLRRCAQPPSQTSDGSRHVVLELANGIFVQKGLALQQPFLNNLMTNYGSGVELVDFKANSNGATDQINNWVASETNNAIPKLIPLGSLNGMTRLLLVNALHLNASWLTPFDPRRTSAQAFHGTTDTAADFMNSTLSLNCAAGTEWQAVDIPYYGGALVMTAVLPKSGKLDSVKTSLTAAWFSNFDVASRQQQVALTLPKFKLTGSTVSWKPSLQALGMASLFDMNSCNLNGIAQQEQVYVSDVLQQVYVAVAEKGTEAVAATAVLMATASLEQPPPTSIVFDRPFLFFVRVHRGPILFAGQVMSLP